MIDFRANEPQGRYDQIDESVFRSEVERGFQDTGVQIEGVTQQLTPDLNVAAFGAVGDGVADDTGAIQAALDAVPSSGGTVQFGEGVYRVFSPLVIETNGTVLRGVGMVGTVLRGNASDQDLIQFGTSGNGVSRCRFESMRFHAQANAGHVFQIIGGCSLASWYNVAVTQSNPARSILKLDTTGLSGNPGYIDNTWIHCLLVHNADATVPAVHLQTTSNTINRNLWCSLRCDSLGSDEYFFELENINNSSSFCQDNHFYSINFERVEGGAIRLLGVARAAIRDCAVYDTTDPVSHIFYVGESSTSRTSERVVFDNVGRASSFITPGAVDDIHLESGAVDSPIITVGDATSLSDYTIDLGSNSGVLLLAPRDAVVNNPHNTRTIIVNPGFAGTSARVELGVNVAVSRTSGNTLSIEGNVDMPDLPTSDPTVAGRLWNDSGTLRVSAG